MLWTTTAALCIILLGSTLVLYHQLTKGIVSRARADQAPRSGFGIIEVDGTQQELGTQLRADGVDIIFVHGLGSNPDTTWRARLPRTDSASLKAVDLSGEDVCWVTDFLVEDLAPAARRKTRLFFYNHDSYWQREAVQTRLWNLAGNMLHQVQENVRRTKEERSRGLIFVGYSYGGLLIKQALVRAKSDPTFEDIPNQTKGILYLGTPHRGSSFTGIGSIAASLLRPLGSNRSILDEIAYDALNLQDLHEQFSVVMGEGLRICNFYEERKTCLVNLGVMQWTKFCVEEQSAKYFDSSQHVQNVGLAVDHFGLNKFGSRTAEYWSIHNKLFELLPPVPQDIYSVPAVRVRTYTSRDELSRRVNEILQSPAVKEDSYTLNDYRVLIIHGMGGVGKTQLALNYIEEHKEWYSPIFWIDAHTPETVRLSFERGAVALGLTLDTAVAPHLRLQDSPVVAGVLRWFSERDKGDRKWLVVVDNADDTSWKVEEIIPQGLQGHVIVTSQHPQSSRFLSGGCRRLNVGTMAQDEARALLKRHVGLQDKAVSVDVGNLCDQVAQHLGCLALAVDLAGAYLNEQLEFRNGEHDAVVREETIKAELRQYLMDYNRHQDELLQWSPFYQLSSYEKTVWTVWDTSLAAIEKISPRSSVSQVLTFLAHFNQGSMQEELFRLASNGWSKMSNLLQLPEDGLVPGWLRKMLALQDGQWNGFHYRQAVQPLLRYGLLQRLGGNWTGTTMHGLVLWRARKANQEDDAPWAQWTRLFMIAAVCQTNRERGQPQFRRHVVAHLSGIGRIVLNHDQKMHIGKDIMARVWVELAEVYHGEGRWSKAEELEVQVMEVRTRVLGEEHPSTLTSMANLAVTYSSQGRETEAEELKVRVMEVRTRVLGEEHPSTLTSMANLASTYRSQGRWTEAEKLEVRVMEAETRVLGEEHPDTLTSMANLAVTYSSQGRQTEAEKLEVRVMEAKTRVLGEEHPDTLTSMANLAVTYSSQGRQTEAEKLEVRVMEAKTRVLGEEHPDTLTSMANLASTYRSQGRWTEAEKLEVRVMEAKTRVLGEEHPDTLTSMANLAVTYSSQGRWTEAEELKVRVMEVRTRVLGEKHPDTLSSMANLAVTYSSQGRETEAEELKVRVIEVMTRVLGEEHPDTLTSMANLAVTYSRQGRQTEAEKLEVQVMEVMTRVLGEEHPDTLTSMANLAVTYSSQGRWTEAEELKVRVMEVMTRVLGEEHPSTLTSVANLAATYSSQGRWTEAEKLEVRVMEAKTRVLGEEHPSTLTSMANLAATYSSQGRQTEAEELEVRVMEVRTRVLGEEHPSTLTSMNNLAHTWKMQGRQEDAMALMDRCVRLFTQKLGVDHPNTVTVTETLRSWRLLHRSTHVPSHSDEID